MTHDTLFGYLATRFSTHPENLATESLNFVLGKSEAARRAFVRFFRQSGASLPESLAFRTQARGEDQSIPDLVGCDSDGANVFIGEAKFWAGLTDAQPVTYIKSLPSGVDSILAFISPAKRMDSLWMELARRCKAAEIAFAEIPQVAPDLRIAELGDRRFLVLASWKSLLQSLDQALVTQHEHAAAADVVQLAGLCDRMDDDAFLPLASDELTGTTGRRIRDFCGLVDSVTELLVNEGLASTQGVRASAGSGWYGRYMRLCGACCILYFSASKWSSLQSTPLWLGVLSDGWKWVPSPAVREALSGLALEKPPRLVEDKDGIHVPLFLPMAVERDRVLAALMDQVKAVSRLLEPVTSSAASPESGEVQPVMGEDTSCEPPAP